MIGRESLNPRQPIIVMLIVGSILVCVLSLLPYSLARNPLAQLKSALAPGTGAAVEAEAPKRAASAEPLFDVASWYAERGEQPETHGVLIESLAGDRTFASHNVDEAFNPASLIKLATSLVALKKLGADYRFQIRVYADGEVDRTGTLRGHLYVSGSDPTFGDIGAHLIAKELQSRGIKRVSEAIVVSPDFCFNFSESAEDSAARLSKALDLGSPQPSIAEGTAGRLLFSFNSYALRDVLLYMNARSSNFVAERIGALVGGPAGVQQFLTEQLQLPAGEVTIERVSGREHNRMTARGVVTVIRALVEETGRQGLEPTDIMPVASDDAGTLRRRLAGTGLEGAVVGKTGTLTSEVDGGMSSLAGLVYTQDAGIILFAILDQGNRIGDHRQMEDQLLADAIKSQATPRAVAGPTPRQLLPAANLKITGENGE
jgi:D-alanyl-D-alanine carboxypeptidase/D-alanyl-D-alanine-endopeptidase (penicillin-binding protein 4)